MTIFRSTKRNLLAGSAAAVLGLAVASSAHAQTADVEEDEVVATGIRQSIIDSLKLKKESTSIVEAITAEDIGKLPDVSIADSLARLPGVTAQRVRGRSQQISIRGLGPDFSIALLNGREMVSAGNNRGIEFDVFPSELIAQGVVYKTPDARLAATGIAGAIDLRTVRPLDKSEMSLTASAKYIINDNGQLNPDFADDGYRLFGSYIDQNEAGTLGWSLGFTTQSNPTQFFSRELKTAVNQTGTTADGSRFPNDNPRSGVVSRDFKRTSFAGTLQFEPTDAFQATLDVGFSDFEDEGIFRGVETPLAIWAGVEDPTTTGTGPFVDSATYQNVGPIIRTDTEGNSAEILSVGLNVSNQFTDRLKGTIDVSMSTLDKEDIDYESYAGTGGRIFRQIDWDNGGAILPARDASLLDTLTYTFDPSGEYSINAGQNYADPNNVFLTDPGGWGQVGFVKEPSIEDDLIQLRGELEYGVEKGFIDGIVVGALITDRKKTFNSNESFLRPGAGFTTFDTPYGTTFEASIPGAADAGTTDSGDIGLNVVVYDPADLRADGTYGVEAANSVAWTVEEDIATLYGMVNIYNEGSVPVRGNIGLRYVDTTQSSTGTLAGTGEQTLGTSYTHWLPSANLSFEVMEDAFIRVAAAKTLTRPRLDQMTANQTISLNSMVCNDADNNRVVEDVAIGAFNPDAGQTCFNLGGGNPLLKPYEGTNFDLAFEKYFGDDSAFAVAVFHKDISDYVQDNSILIDGTNQITSFGSAATLVQFPQLATTRLSSADNFEKATITGFEATLRQNLDRFLPDSLSGFGIDASYTYVDSSIELDNGDNPDIPGYSKNTWSASAYYEKNGFRARLNSRHRSGFLSEIQQFDGTLDGQRAKGETILDAQIGYEWDEGPLEGFGVNVEAYNLTDEPFRTVRDLDGNGPGTDDYVSRHELYGRTFNFTVSKKF